MAEEKDFLEVIREAGGDLSFFEDLRNTIITRKKADLSDCQQLPPDTKPVGKLTTYEHALGYLSDKYMVTGNLHASKYGNDSFFYKNKYNQKAAGSLYWASLNHKFNTDSETHVVVCNDGSVILK